jgi:ubiquinone/menaquinone biosynthesis C-methylase UbiE
LIATSPREQWNHNNHYHDWLLRSLPSRFERALDVGCGCGFFAARLSSEADHVDAIDSDGAVLDEASRLNSSPRIRFLHGDFLAMGLPSDTYDVVTSIAALHHMDFARALAEMKRVLRPGGRLAVLGLFREVSLIDYAVSLMAIPANLLRTHIVDQHRASSTMAAPTREPTLSLAQIRESASSSLPGVQVERRLYWRYSLLWRKPATPSRVHVDALRMAAVEKHVAQRALADDARTASRGCGNQMWSSRP